MYSESAAIQYSGAGGSVCGSVGVCVWFSWCVCACVRRVLYHPDVASSSLHCLQYQATVATVVDPQTAGMWIEKFCQPRSQDRISPVPNSTLIIRKMEALSGPVFCGLEILKTTDWMILAECRGEAY